MDHVIIDVLIGFGNIDSLIILLQLNKEYYNKITSNNAVKLLSSVLSIKGSDFKEVCQNHILRSCDIFKYVELFPRYNNIYLLEERINEYINIYTNSEDDDDNDSSFPNIFSDDQILVEIITDCIYCRSIKVIE